MNKVSWFLVEGNLVLMNVLNNQGVHVLVVLNIQGAEMLLWQNVVLVSKLSFLTCFL